MMNMLPCFKPPALGEFRTVYANHRCPSGEVGISIHDAHQHCADNVVKTSKYEIWNFLPKNLFGQFRRVANFYFLCIVIVQFAIQDRTPVSPATSLVPLLFVIIVTAVKQGYEDWKRHQADKEVNNRSTVIISDGHEKDVFSKDVRVGDILKISNNEELPCDMVVVSSCDDEGQCHIMTANLDGETNLKLRCGVSGTIKKQSLEELSSLQAKVECDHPDSDMYKYNGRITVYNDNGQPVVFPLGPSNLLLRGAKLRNTDYCYGLAVYTGRETKMAMNQKQKVSKFSSLEKTMNKYLILFLIVLLLQAALCTALKITHEKSNSGEKAWYMPSPNELDAVEVMVDLLSFLILFNYIIPISLYVTLELQKFSGSLFFNWDLELYHTETDEPAKANTSDLNEELGQIEYLFSDKTGTLTENDMQFRQCSVNGTKFVDINNRIVKDGAGSGLSHGLSKELKEFFVALALCHTVQADPVDKPETNGVAGNDATDSPTDTVTVYKYQASSPDEKALCEAAAKYGVTFKGKSGDYMEILVKDKVERYKLLHVLEFDSTRKRMSVIVETPCGEILMLCKGAESHVLPRCSSGDKDLTLQHIDEYAEIGLRTLTIVSKKIPKSDYASIDNKLVKAQQAINDREDQLANVFDEIENDFMLLGATGVEDKLQDGVEETIKALRVAGIKVWVLTGDKLETAVNISYSCGHFYHDMEIMGVTNKKTDNDVKIALDECKRIIESHPVDKENFGIVVDGFTLSIILASFAEEFLEVCFHCSAVLCCRMSPLQKAEVVKLVKNSNADPITLAIGDGANDCSMIQEAHVGCGIMGKEGRQAVRCSDYAFHRFRYLKRVLLVHGHFFYTRLAIVVQYFFYKNVAFILPQFLYQFYNGYSTNPIYSGVFLTCYNIVFTSMPIMLYGMFEQDLKPETLMENPVLYRDQANNEKLSWRQFGYWTLSGLWHGVVMFVGIKILFDHSPFAGDMVDHGLFSFGTFVFTLVVVISNLKLALVMHYWTWFMHFFLWGSILIYIIFVLVLCSSLWPWPFLRDWFDLDLDLDLYNVIYMLFNTSMFWAAAILIIVVSLVPDIIGSVLFKYFKPTRTQQLQVMEGEGFLVNNKVHDSNTHGGSMFSLHALQNGTTNKFERDDVKLIKSDSDVSGNDDVMKKTKKNQPRFV